MLRLRTKKTHDPERSANLPDGHDIYHYNVEQIFLGHHTIFSLLGLAIGADLVGRTIFEMLSGIAHPILMIVLGLSLFILSGMLVGSFDD